VGNTNNTVPFTAPFAKHVKKDKRQWMPKRRAPNVQSVNTKMASIP
jgi:hypothetical protein|tara:strand:- start:1030 stop:1167 length:138 start_codon:yes stop_codon:yes gene_type:complete